MELNAFINRIYGATDAKVTGKRRDIDFTATIVDTRVKYGRDISVMIKYDDTCDPELLVCEGAVLTASALFRGEQGSFTELEVIFE